MIFLPIVDRELRVASRKRSTFWVRIIAALVALLIGSAFLVLTTVGPFRFGATTLGRGLFGALTWLSLGTALSAGLFFTSDCLSEEKREGTLGFLFLTDLSGYDVVLGKLLATSLRGFYALLAIFPILAVTLLMGGVTGAQFWKTALALVNALVFSLAAGLFVSAISRESQKALAATLILLVLLVAGGPACDAIITAVRRNSFEPRWSLSSPGYLFVTAGGWAGNPFWKVLLVNQAVAWMLLVLTCALLPRIWQEKSAKTSTAAGSPGYWLKFGGAGRRARLRQKLLGMNPILWLSCRERWQTVTLWGLAILLAGGYTLIFTTDDRSMWWVAWNTFAGVATLVLYLGVASQAGQFFVNARRSGLIELLLATPLTAIQIVQGHWRALLRMFGPALAICLVAQLLGMIMVQERTWKRFATVTAPPAATAAAAASSATPATTTTTNAMIVTTSTGMGSVSVSAGGFNPPGRLATVAMSVAGTIKVVANLTALIWFGMWMGLNSKNANLATLKTIVFVQIIPWFVVSFASALIVPLVLLPRLISGGSAAPSRMMIWYPLLTTGVATVLILAKDSFFVFWARRKLYSEFRERTMPVLLPIRLAVPPPLPPRMQAPPLVNTSQP